MPPTKQNKKQTKATKARKPVKKAEHARDKLDMNQPLTVSVARIANRVDKKGWNSDVTLAINELSNGEPHVLINKETKKETMTAQIPIADMSAATIEILEIATARYDKSQVKRIERIEKKILDATTAWEDRKCLLIGQRKKDIITQKEYDTKIADGDSTFNVVIAAFNTELTTEPQLINKKKLDHTLYEDKMALIQKLRYRISNNVSATTAAACTVWVCELLRHGMDNVIAQDKSFLKCQHIFTDGLENLTYLPFYDRLPTYIAGRQIELERRAVEDEKKRNRNKKKKEATTAPVASDTSVGEVDDEDDDNDDNESGVKFNHHIKQTCLFLQKRMESEDMSEEKLERYQGIRISEEIKTFCSNLISEFNGTMIRIIKAELAKAKVTTVNVSHIHHALRLFLLINHNDPEPLINDVVKMVEQHNIHQAQKNEDRKAKAALAKSNADADAE